MMIMVAKWGVLIAMLALCFAVSEISKVSELFENSLDEEEN